MDPFATLGLHPTADVAEIRRAWRRRARETHPDHGGDPQAFTAVHQAFRLLVPPPRAGAPAPVVVKRPGPSALALRWWRRRCDRSRHPRVA